MQWPPHAIHAVVPQAGSPMRPTSRWRRQDGGQVAAPPPRSPSDLPRGTDAVCIPTLAPSPLRGAPAPWASGVARSEGIGGSWDGVLSRRSRLRRAQPPPSPRLDSSQAGAAVHNGTAELLLLHTMGSSHASPAFSPTLVALPGNMVDGAVPPSALPPGALPEGSAELLLLKKARHAC